MDLRRVLLGLCALLLPSLAMAQDPVKLKAGMVTGIDQIGLVADRGRDDPDVVKLWIGEGDLPTPDFITEAAARAMRSPRRSAASRACTSRS